MLVIMLRILGAMLGFDFVVTLLSFMYIKDKNSMIARNDTLVYNENCSRFYLLFFMYIKDNKESPNYVCTTFVPKVVGQNHRHLRFMLCILFLSFIYIKDNKENCKQFSLRAIMVVPMAQPQNQAAWSNHIIHLTIPNKVIKNTKFYAH